MNDQKSKQNKSYIIKIIHIKILDKMTKKIHYKKTKYQTKIIN